MAAPPGRGLRLREFFAHVPSGLGAILKLELHQFQNKRELKIKESRATDDGLRFSIDVLA